MSGTTVGELPDAEIVSAKIAELKEKLQTSAPGYESLLHSIHRILAADENLSHILKPEEIGVVTAALAKRKNLVIAELTVKGTGGGRKKAASNITLEDL